MTVMKDEVKLLTDLRKRHNALKQVKLVYEGMIDNLLEFCNHTRRQITDKSKGTVTGAEVFDGTANSANKIQADGFFGNLCSQSLRWFSESLPNKINWPRWSGNMRKYSGKRLDEIPEVKVWLEACDDVMYAAFLRSNFYDEMPVLFRDGGSVGCGNMYKEEDIKQGRAVYTVLHPREYVVGLDYFGRVDTEFRTYSISIRQLVSKFGMDALKDDLPNIEQLHENNPYDERDVVHAVLPREDFDPDKKDNKNKAWASYWYLDSGRKLLLESGYDHFPFIHWQFNKDNQGYGSGPGHEAWIEIKTANQQAMSNLIAGQKMVEPPMVIHNTLRGAVRIGPKGQTFVQDMNMRPMPLMENINLPYAIEMLDASRKVIKDKWHVDFFMMLSQAAFDRLDITATQVMEMVSEKATMLGTVVGRIASDVLNPVIDLTFYDEQAAGRIPQMPQIMLDSGLTNAKIEVDYTGPLAMAQKRAHSTQGIRQGLTFIGEVAQIFPQAVKKIKWNETIAKALTDFGFPAECLATDDEFNAAMEDEKKQQQGMMEAEQMERMSKILPAAGKAIEPNSPADMLVEGMGGKLKGQGEAGEQQGAGAIPGVEQLTGGG